MKGKYHIKGSFSGISMYTIKVDNDFEVLEETEEGLKVLVYPGMKENFIPKPHNLQFTKL